jgi:hypothetical protein
MTDKQRAERIHYHMYTTNEGIAEHAERIVALEELCADMWRDGMCECDERGACAECEYHFPDRMRKLGIPRGQ